MTIPANFSAKNSESYINVQWWIAIDGLRHRFGTCKPTWNPTDTTTNQTIKDYMSEIIQCREQRVEPLNGKTTSHGLTISLLDVGDDITELFSVHDTTNKFWTALTSNCTASAATLHVTATSAFTTPCELYVGGETMWAPTKTTSTFHIHRAKYGSIADDHKITDDAGLDQLVEVWNAPRYITGRGVTLYESRDGLVEADAIKLRCVIDTVKEKSGIWTIGASGHLSKLAALLNRKMPWRYIKRVGSEMYIQGGEGTYPTPSGFKYPWIQFGERYFDYSSGGGAQTEAFEVIVLRSEQFLPLPTNNINGVPNWSDTTFSDTGAILLETINYDTCSAVVSHALFWDGIYHYTDPLSILLCLLLSKKGNKTNHATYDILPEGVGLGWPSAWVDVTGIEALRDSTHLGDYNLSFVIPAGEDAKKWIEENLLRPNMLFVVEKWDGTVSVSRLLTRNEAIVHGSDLDITESMLLDEPELDISNYPIGEIAWKINWHPIKDEFQEEIKIVFAESIRRYGSNARKYELECKTCYDNGSYNSSRLLTQADTNNMPDMIGEYAATMFNQFASNPMPALTIEIPYNRLTDVPPGSVVKVTCSITPNLMDSSRGFTEEWFQVVGVTPQPKNSSIRLMLWQIGVHDVNSARYSPSARLKSKSDNHLGTGRCKITTTSNFYTVSSQGTDVHQMLAGSKLRFYNANYVSLDSRTYTVYSTPTAANNQMWLSETSLKFSVTSGYLVEAANYDECVTAQITNWGYQAGSNKRLGTGEVEGNQRT
jgi:hypothetical protein